MSWRFALPLLVLSLLASPSIVRPEIADAQTGCTFKLGFKALRDLIPNVVGDCLDDERFNEANGNAEQRTTGGLLVWRKADNWTAFTDGSTTWIMGPEGLVSRPNAGPLYPWEAAPPSHDELRGCATALSTARRTWEGNPFPSLTWGGEQAPLEPLLGQPVAICIASGPPEIFGARQVNAVGCVLVSQDLARTSNNPMCGAYHDISRSGAADLRWVERFGAFGVRVTGFRWDQNAGFVVVRPTYFACLDREEVPVSDVFNC